MKKCVVLGFWFGANSFYLERAGTCGGVLLEKKSFCAGEEIFVVRGASLRFTRKIFLANKNFNSKENTLLVTARGFVFQKIFS